MIQSGRQRTPAGYHEIMKQAVHSPTTASFIAYHARLGKKVAIEMEGGVVSYAQLGQDIDLAARYLAQHKLAYQDVLVVALSDAYSHLVFVLAGELLGLLSCSIQVSEDVLPADVMASARLVLGEASAPPLACTYHQLSPHWRDVAKTTAPLQPVALQDTDSMRLVRSSGTTGTPKKIVIRRDRQARWLASLAFAAGFGPHTRLYVAAPFTVNTFYMRVVLCLRMGGSLLMGSLSMLSRATHTWMLPSTLDQVMDTLPAGFVKPERLEINTAGAPLAAATRARVIGALASRIVNSYGSNETPFLCTMTDEGLGVVEPGTEVQVVDEQDQVVPMGTAGQLRARNAIMIDGYLDNPQATAERFKEGWFYPGDEALMLAPGVLRLVGRTDDMLNFAGFKHRPEDVEATLKSLPGVQDAAALTDLHGDGVVTLYLGLVLQPDVTVETLAPAVRAALNLPVKRMVMRQFSSLPYTGTGKLRRKALLPYFLNPQQATGMDAV